MKYLLFTFIIILSSCKTNKIASDINYTTDVENKINNNNSSSIFQDNSYRQYQYFKDSIKQK